MEIKEVLKPLDGLIKSLEYGSHMITYGNAGLLNKDNQYIAGSEIPEGAGYNLRYLRDYFGNKVELHISSLKWQTDAAISADGNFIIMPMRV